MSTIDGITKANRRLIRDLIAGMAGLTAATVFVVVTVMFQDYSTLAFVKISLFVFPVPVACGLAVGLISPRQAIVWAPLWSCIFALLFFAVLVGSIHQVSAAFSPDILAHIAVGLLLAALAGLAGQYASDRGFVARVVVVFLLSCCLMGIIEYGLVARPDERIRIGGETTRGGSCRQELHPRRAETRLAVGAMADGPLQIDCHTARKRDRGGHEIRTTFHVGNKLRREWKEC